MDGVFEPLHRDDLVGRESEDGPGPSRGPEDPGGVVQDPDARLGGIRRQSQALLAFSQGFVCPPASQCVGEDLCDQLQALDHRVWPVALRPQRIEADEADGRLAAHGERQAQMRLDAVVAAVLAVDAGLRRELLQRGQGDHAAGQDLLPDPGELLLAQRLGRKQPFQGGVGVGGCDHVRGGCRPLPQHREIDPEELADTAQCVLYGTVHLAGRQVDEPRGEVGDERLELETTPDGLRGARRVFGLGHVDNGTIPRHPRTSREARLVVSRGHNPPGSH